MTRRATAYHEAGHAVIGTIFGCRVRKLSIKPMPGYWGACWFDKPARSAKRRIIIDLAGQVAESFIVGELGVEPDQDDVERAVELAQARCPDPRALDYLHGFTQALVREHWPEIEAVARLLLKRETISGRDVRRIVPGVPGKLD